LAEKSLLFPDQQAGHTQEQKRASALQEGGAFTPLWLFSSASYREFPLCRRCPLIVGGHGFGQFGFFIGVLRVFGEVYPIVRQYE
jgi:hypothetical protein